MGSYKIVNNQRTVIIYSQGLTTSLYYSGSGELNLYKSHMKYNENYCEFLGKMREDIYEQFGESPYSDIDKQIMYLLSDGDFEYFVFNFDTWTNSVKAVSIVAKELPSFTNAETNEYLNSAYYVYEKVQQINNMLMLIHKLMTKQLHESFGIHIHVS